MDKSSSLVRSCRVCFESDESESSLISPCQCRGSSLYIHQHCLEQWQDVALSSSQPMRAVLCPTCSSPYVSPTWVKLMSWQCWKHALTYMQFFASKTMSFANSVLLSPIKFALQMGLFMLTIPSGRCHLDERHELVWMGLDFPPQLSIMYSSPALIPGLRRGCLLVSTPKMEERNSTSYHFHKAVILILEHSLAEGSVGIVINRRDHEVLPSVSASNIFNLHGGPINTDCVTVIHQVATCSLHSKCIMRSNSQENADNGGHLYVAQFDKAIHTIQMLADAIRKDSAQNQAHSRIEDAHSKTSKPLSTLPIYLFKGHCQWLPNQLEGEIRAGLWQVLSVDAADNLQNCHPLQEDIWSNLRSPVTINP